MLIGVAVFGVFAVGVLLRFTGVGRGKLNELVQETFKRAGEAADEQAFDATMGPADADPSQIEISQGKDRVGDKDVDVVWCQNKSALWYSGTVEVAIAAADGKVLRTERIELHRLPPGVHCSKHFEQETLPENTSIRVQRQGSFETVAINARSGYELHLEDVLNMHMDALMLTVVTPVKDPAKLRAIGNSLRKLYPHAPSLRVKFLEKLPDTLATLPRVGVEGLKRHQVVSAAAHGEYYANAGQEGRFIVMVPQR